ncbi:MAG: hypothetical protein U9N53_09495 [Bacteroidota bacterium]|nr:hypothetical protein [Bacteroidota bacterium]
MIFNLNKIEQKALNITYIPVVLIIFDVSRAFADKVGLIETLLLLMYCIYFILFVRGILTTNIWITIFLCYALILAFFSSDIERTIINYTRVFISLFMFPIAYYQVKTLSDLRKLNLSIIWLIIIFVLNGIVTSTLGIGANPYRGSFVMGIFIYSKLYSGSLALVLIPLWMTSIKRNFYKYVLLFFSFILFILLLLSMRRTAILIPIFGYMIYFFYSHYKKQIVIGFVSIIAFLVLSFPLYKDILYSQMAARRNIFNRNYNIANEGRYLEGAIVLNERFGNEVHWGITLFGDEVFNEYGKYANGYFGTRYLHVDFYKILYTLGTFGLFFYLMIFYNIWGKFQRYKVNISNDPCYREMVGIFVTLFLLSFFISIQGGMFDITFRSILFIYFGALLGVFEDSASKKQRFITQDV